MSKACQLDTDLPLPHYGLAQLYLQQREDKNAITELETVMKLVPGSVDALKVRLPVFQVPQYPLSVPGHVNILSNWTVSLNLTVLHCLVSLNSAAFVWKRFFYLA